jgi:hypothetical protein
VDVGVDAEPGEGLDAAEVVEDGEYHDPGVGGSSRTRARIPLVAFRSMSICVTTTSGLFSLSVPNKTT